jgi:DnaJ domain
MNAFDHLDYYGTLGLERNDSPTTSQIKEAYLKVSKVTHPDNSDGLRNPAWFAAATRARDTLVNYESRCAYDEWLRVGIDNPSPPPPTSGPNSAKRSEYSTDRSGYVHTSEDRYYTYLKSRSLLLFFVGFGILYIDRTQPFATPHDFLRYASLIAWGLFWIVPKKMVSWLTRLLRHDQANRRLR